MSDSSEESKPKKSVPIAKKFGEALAEVFKTFPEMFRAELRHGFGKFNFIMALIAFVLAIGFTLGQSSINNFLSFYIVIFVGFLSFSRLGTRERKARRPQKVTPAEKKGKSKKASPSPTKICSGNLRTSKDDFVLSLCFPQGGS